MKQKHTFISFISLVLLVITTNIGYGQSDTLTVANDTIVYKVRYGLRLGGDLGKIARTLIEEGYTGFEIQGDYRLTRNLYLAGEIGTEDKETETDYLTVNTTGSYFKAGVDYNFYTNWLDMDNLIYGGLRAGLSSFKQNLTSYTIYNTDQYWDNPYTNTDGPEFSGLSAIWTELIIGLKAEILRNLYMGINVQFKYLLTNDEPPNFENIYIPGYNRTYDSGRIGFGYGYNISYLVPIFKKDKKVKQQTP